MAQTPARQIPYAASTDAPDVPYWQQRMAERLEVLLDALDAKFNVDTWTLATVPGTTSPLGGDKVATRMGLDGKTVEFAGGVLTSAIYASGSTLATIGKVSHRPVSIRNVIVATSLGARQVQINTAGVVIYGGADSIPSGGWVDLSSIRFALDSPR